MQDAILRQQSKSLTTPPQLVDTTRVDTTLGGGGGFAQLFENPFFTAGFGLAVLATAARVGQQGLRYGAHVARRRLLINVEITRRDPTYDGLLRWMSTVQSAQLRASHRVEGFSGTAEPNSVLTALVARLVPQIHDLQIKTTETTRPDGSSHTNYSLVPGQGRHILRLGNTFIAVNRQREKTFDISSGEPFETVSMTTLRANKHVFEQIFSEVHALSAQLQEGKTVLYESRGTEWTKFGQPKTKRPLSSVILAEGVKERIVQDVETFLSGREEYLANGAPYRRGYLLHGPPGTGKTSFVMALAGALDFNIAILDLCQAGMSNDRLRHLVANMPARTILLLEDVDAAFAGREMTDGQRRGSSMLSFSGLLNALDGVGSGEGHIIFLTTNHLDRLDTALIRTGRVDLLERLDAATLYQMGQLWELYYGKGDQDGSGKQHFLARIQELGLPGKVSTAALQGLFLRNRNNMQGAVDGLTQRLE